MFCVWLRWTTTERTKEMQNFYIARFVLSFLFSTLKWMNANILQYFWNCHWTMEIFLVLVSFIFHFLTIVQRNYTKKKTMNVWIIESKRSQASEVFTREVCEFEKKKKRLYIRKTNFFARYSFFLRFRIFRNQYFHENFDFLKPFIGWTSRNVLYC